METTDITSTFTTAVGCFDMIQVGKQAAAGLGKRRVQLDIVQARLCRWGQAAGFNASAGAGAIEISSGLQGSAHDQDSATPQWTIRECDDRTISQADEFLMEISYICGQAEDDYKSRVGHSNDRFQGTAEDLDLAVEDELKAYHWMTNLRQSLRKGLQQPPNTQIARTTTGSKWALYEQEKFDVFIKDISDNLDKLENLFPPEQCSVLGGLAKAQAGAITDRNLRNLIEVTPECDELLKYMAGQVLEQRESEQKESKHKTGEMRLKEMREAREAREAREEPVSKVRASVRAHTNNGLQLGNMMGGSIGPVTTHTNNGTQQGANYGPHHGNQYHRYG